ncbi:hypothetical protein SDC9_121161 [bioreactor metagenome]|uniref:Uncharacterized protein n=1 Tax=bioreactor metagenome TaxID=1076179 RepID=A0A645CB59_9ZZZZ
MLFMGWVEREQPEARRRDDVRSSSPTRRKTGQARNRDRPIGVTKCDNSG